LTYGSLSNFNDPCFCTSLKARSVRPLLDGQGRDIHLEDGEVVKSELLIEVERPWFVVLPTARRLTTFVLATRIRKSEKEKKNVYNIDMTNEKWFGPRVVLAA
jgi:hypothetical protein